MKRIRTTVPKSISLSDPAKKANVLFHEIEKNLSVEEGVYRIQFRSSEIIPAIVGTGTAENPEFPERYVMIKEHQRVVGNPNALKPISHEQLNDIVGSLNIDKIGVLDKEIQELLESIKSVLISEKIYGIVEGQLIIE